MVLSRSGASTYVDGETKDHGCIYVDGETKDHGYVYRGAYTTVYLPQIFYPQSIVQFYRNAYFIELCSHEKFAIFICMYLQKMIQVRRQTL